MSLQDLQQQAQKKGVHDLKRATLQLLSGQFVIEVLHSSSFKKKLYINAAAGQLGSACF